MTCDDPEYRAEEERRRDGLERRLAAAIWKLKIHKRALENPITVFSAIGVAAVVALIYQCALEWAIKVHWIMALVISIGVWAAYIWLVPRENKAPYRVILAFVLSLGLFLAIVSCSGLSHCMQVAGWVKYTGASAHSLNDFIHFYFFVLADLIPLVDIPETLHLPAPIQSQDPGAGVPALLFKLFVVFFVLDRYGSFQARRKKASMAKRIDLVVLLACLLLFVALFLGVQKPIH